MNFELIFTRRCQHKISKFYKAVGKTGVFFDIYECNKDFPTIYFMIDIEFYLMECLLLDEKAEFEKRKNIALLLLYYGCCLDEILMQNGSEEELALNIYLVDAGAEISDQLFEYICFTDWTLFS